jgi:hypothetical protein
MKIINLHFTLSKQVFVSFVLLALCVLSGCDNFYDALKFGEDAVDGSDNADGVDDLSGGNRVLVRLVDLDNFGITVDDGAPSPTPTEVLEDTTQFTMASDGSVNFGESGSMEVQANDIVIVQGSSQTGTVTIIRPTITPPPTPQ